jgi:hypothetical protein
MTERREHYISAAYSGSERDLTFSSLIRSSKDEFLNRTVINDKPPPSREVVLVVAVDNYAKILSSSLEKVFGFVFESELFLENLKLKPDFIMALQGLLARVLRSNETIRHYGVSVALFIGEGSPEELKYVYGAMKEVCSKASSTEVIIDFDIIQDDQELKTFLKGQLFKIVHGDIKAQFEA